MCPGPTPIPFTQSCEILLTCLPCVCLRAATRWHLTLLVTVFSGRSTLDLTPISSQFFCFLLWTLPINIRSSWGPSSDLNSLAPKSFFGGVQKVSVCSYQPQTWGTSRLLFILSTCLFNRHPRFCRSNLEFLISPNKPFLSLHFHSHCLSQLKTFHYHLPRYLAHTSTSSGLSFAPHVIMYVCVTDLTGAPKNNIGGKV